MSAAFEPAPLRPRRRLEPGLVVLLAAAVAVVLGVAKPWGDPAAAPAPTSGVATLSSPSTTTILPSAGRAFARPLAVATAAPVTVSERRARLVDELVAWLAGDAGSWGVGSGGSTPGPPGAAPYEPSSAWTFWTVARPLQPPISTAAVVPACARATPVPAGAFLIAITAPKGIVPDWTVRGRRVAGATSEDLDSILRTVAPPGNHGIRYLFRTDERPWAAGFYRFELVGPSTPVFIEACVAPDSGAAPG